MLSRLLAALLAAVILGAASSAAAGAQSRVFTLPDSAKLAVPAQPSSPNGTVTTACTDLAGRPDCTSGELIAGCAARLKQDPGWCSSYAFALRDRDPGWLESVQRNTPPTAARDKPPKPRPAKSEQDKRQRVPAPKPSTPGPTVASGVTGAAGASAVKEEELFSGTGRDLLSSNGLISPWCSGHRTHSAAAQRNCEASGSTATDAAADNVGFDKHIDTTSALGIPKADQTFASIVVTLMQVGWAICIGITRGVFFLVELALSFNPLEAIGGQRALQLLSGEVRAITRPLALILAPAGAIWVIAQFGWARRQGEALKHALISTLLITAAVVVLTNPVGTVGALLTISQQVGLAIIGAVTAPVTSTSPTNGSAGAQAGLRALSDGLIDQPLALLEFGDVAFGTDPDKLDGELKKAALKLAEDDPEKLATVRAARTNLDLFKVWPAGSAQRNSINDEGSLLRTLCATEKATSCEGPHAARAEFRTEKGTWQRAIALLVIAAGLIPVWIALLFTAFKLLEAGLMCLIRLCQLVFVVPLAVLGRVGNERVISYAGALTGNLLASTAYSAFLALIFLLWVLLTRFGTLGFVGQWLLLAVTLWLLVRHHDSLWGTARAQDGQMRSRGMQLAQTMFAHRVARAAGGAGRRGRRGATWPARAATRAATGQARRWSNEKVARAQSRPGRGRDALGDMNTTAAAPGGSAARRAGDESGSTTAGAAALAGGGGVVAARSAGGRGSVRDKRAGAAARATLAGGGKSAAWARLRAQHKALGTTRSRHATEILSTSLRPDLQQRRDRVGAELAGVAAALPAATGRQRQLLLRRGTSLAQRAQRLDGHLAQFTRAQRVSEEIVSPKQRTAREARFLDAQNRLRRGQAPSPGRAREHRNYVQLASLIGQTPRDYRTSSAREQLRARARIDRQLAQRAKDQREVRRPAVRATAGAAAGSAPEAAAPTPGGGGGAKPGRRGGPRPVGSGARRRAPSSDR